MLHVMAVRKLDLNAVAGPWTRFSFPASITYVTETQDGRIICGFSDGKIAYLDEEQKRDYGTEDIQFSLKTKKFILQTLTKLKTLRAFRAEVFCDDVQGSYDSRLLMQVLCDDSNKPALRTVVKLENEINERMRAKGRYAQVIFCNADEYDFVLTWIGPVEVLWTEAGVDPSA